jgi:hypothetical protein
LLQETEQDAFVDVIIEITDMELEKREKESPDAEGCNEEEDTEYGVEVAIEGEFGFWSLLNVQFVVSRLGSLELHVMGVHWPKIRNMQRLMIDTCHSSASEGSK